MKNIENFARFLGWNTQGDLGPWTFYTDKRKGLVFFVKSPPLEPPSILQTSIRNKFRLAAYTWRSISPARRADWMLAAERAHLQIHGYNLFVFWNLRRDDAAIHTIERITNIQLIPLDYRM